MIRLSELSAVVGRARLLYSLSFLTRAFNEMTFLAALSSIVSKPNRIVQPWKLTNVSTRGNIIIHVIKNYVVIRLIILVGRRENYSC